MAGIVDTHAHINEPGRTEWEGFETATRAAAAGGVTTVIDMPLNSIPATLNLEALKIKAASAQNRCTIDYGFWGGIVPENCKDLGGLGDSGVMGAKTFLIESGVDEFPMTHKKELEIGMKALAKAGLPLLVHAELESLVSSNSKAPEKYKSYLESRPQKWEVDAIKLIIELIKNTGCRAHIVHLSASDALETIAKARREGLPLTVETCPHYLTFASEEISEKATQFKCAPPIRQKENRERLWLGLIDGHIDMIVSDHSPCLPKLKKLETGDFMEAWGGISGIQFSLPAIWTQMRQRNLSIQDLTRWMSAHPAKLIGLEKKKGKIAEGLDADFVIWDPETSFTLNESQVKHRHRLTPYLGKTMFGVVKKTYVRGNSVYDNGHFSKSMVGQWIKRQVI